MKFVKSLPNFSSPEFAIYVWMKEVVEDDMFLMQFLQVCLLFLIEA
jgi:hypothetical protein